MHPSSLDSIRNGPKHVCYRVVLWLVTEYLTWLGFTFSNNQIIIIVYVIKSQYNLLLLFILQLHCWNMFWSLDRICNWLPYFSYLSSWHNVKSHNLKDLPFGGACVVSFSFFESLKFEIFVWEKKTCHLGFKVSLSIFSNLKSARFMSWFKISQSKTWRIKKSWNV